MMIIVRMSRSFSGQNKAFALMVKEFQTAIDRCTVISASSVSCVFTSIIETMRKDMLFCFTLRGYSSGGGILRTMNRCFCFFQKPVTYTLMWDTSCKFGPWYGLSYPTVIFGNSESILPIECHLKWNQRRRKHRLCISFLDSSGYMFLFIFLHVVSWYWFNLA